MISTALKIQDATQKAFMDENIMMMAGFIFTHRNNVDDEMMSKMLFDYSANLSALVATLVSEAILSETQMKEMISEIESFEKISKEIIKEEFVESKYLIEKIDKYKSLYFKDKRIIINKSEILEEKFTQKIHNTKEEQ